MSFISRMREVAQQLEAPPDPWKKTLSGALKGVEAMSTVALLDIVGARHTTSNGRRLAGIMRDLKFIPIQSRRLMPGGYRDTVARGWARPMRSLPISKKVKTQQGTTSPGPDLETKSLPAQTRTLDAASPNGCLNNIGDYGDYNERWGN